MNVGLLRRAWGVGALALFAIVGQVSAATITSVTVRAQNNGAGEQMQVPVTFGQVFAPGDVASGQRLTATVAGQRVPLQVDRKASNADGSLRHGVLTAVLPSLSGNQAQVVNLSTHSAQTGSAGTSLRAFLANHDFDARVELDTSRGVYHLNARQLLQKAADNRTCQPWGRHCAVWLSGPLVTEWQVGGPVVDKNNEPHPHLAAHFYVRYYPTAGRLRVAVIVENDWAFQSAPDNFTYDAHISVNGQQVYTRNNLVNADHARWRKVFWVGGNPQVYVKPDLAYLQATGAIPNYQHLSVPESAISKFYKEFQNSNRRPMGASIVKKDMFDYGGRPDIGPLPKWSVLRLLSSDPRLIEIDNTVANLSGSWPMHLRDKATGRPMALSSYPRASTNRNFVGRSSNPLPVAVHKPNTDLQPDPSHEPAMVFVPYLLSGDFYYLEELQFWAAWNPLGTDPGYRGESQGLLNWLQVRGQGWSLRTLGQAAYITPDNDPLKAEFSRQLKNNLDWYVQQVVNKSDANKLGFLPFHVNRPKVNGRNQGRGIAPWEDDFFTWAANYMVHLGFSRAEPLLKWKAKFPVGRMTAPGYCWVSGAIYELNVRDGYGAPFYKTFAKAYKESTSSALQNAACGSAEMAHHLGHRYKAGDMSGYPWSPQGYPANMQPALAAAVDSGINGAAKAWSVFMNRTTKPDYSGYPNWDIVPRSNPPSSGGQDSGDQGDAGHDGGDGAPPSGHRTVTGLTLSTSQSDLHVGDTFKLQARLVYSDGSTAPVSSNRIPHTFNRQVLRQIGGHIWNTTFKAIGAGTTTLKDSNAGQTARIRVTVQPGSGGTAGPGGGSQSGSGDGDSGAGDGGSSGPRHLVGMSLSTNPQQVHVGDTFKLQARLVYSDGTTAPVSSHRIAGGYNHQVVRSVGGHNWNTTFKAVQAGTVTLKDSNAGVRGRVRVNVMP